MLMLGQAALVLVDIQGNLYQAMEGKEALLLNNQKLIQGMATFGVPTLITEQIKIGATIPGIRELLPDVKPILKSSFSCLQEESFVTALTALQRKQILLAGIEAHICVYQTALDLIGQGFQVYLIIDAISSRTAQNKEIAVQRMIDAGAIPASTEMVLFELLKTAASPKAREIFRIVK